MTDNHYYFYLDGDVQRGPVTAEDLIRVITPQTLIWCEGMESWTAASLVPEIRSLLTSNEIVPGGAERVIGTPPPSVGISAGSVTIPAKPNNYLVWSILLTLLCGSIPGIVGIALGITCNQRYAEGDYKGAELASSMARNCILVSVVLAVILLGVVLMMFVSFGSALQTFAEMVNNG